MACCIKVFYCWTKRPKSSLSINKPNYEKKCDILIHLIFHTYVNKRTKQFHHNITLDACEDKNENNKINVINKKWTFAKQDLSPHKA